MNRTFLFAFLSALIMHSLLAFVELNAFKRPVSVTIPPKTLTIDIAKPTPVKKHPLINKPSIVVKEPVLKKEVKEKVEPKQKIKPKIKEKKRIQVEKPIHKEKPAKKDETLTRLSPVDLPIIKKEEDVLEQNYAFVPDMVDISMPRPDIKDIPAKVEKEEAPDSASDIPITYALPIYKRNIPPQYPVLARRRGYKGTVLLEVLVKKNGKAGSIRLARSSGYEILDRAAMNGVKDWLFQPAKRGDELVEIWVEIPIRFQLK